MKNLSAHFELRKAFNTVNHGILLKKLEAYGARGIILHLLASFLKNRKQFVQIDEKVSEVRVINVGVPQRSVLGPLLFLRYINDITDTQDENCSILTSHQHNPFPAHVKQKHQISKWQSANKLTLNLEKTFYLKFSGTKSMRNTLLINEKLPKTESSNKHFEIFIDSDLNFNHVSYVCKKVCIMVGLFIYNHAIKPIIENGLLVYGSTSESQLRPILILQKKILRILYNLPSHACCTHLFTESGVQTVYAMYVGALLKYLLFNFRNIEKCMSSSHNMKTRRQQKALLHYAKTSKLTEN